MKGLETTRENTPRPYRRLGTSRPNKSPESNALRALKVDKWLDYEESFMLAALLVIPSFVNSFAFSHVDEFICSNM